MALGCPHCKGADERPAQIISQHQTSAGLTVWTRCACGSLQARVVSSSGNRVVARGRPEQNS